VKPGTCTDVPASERQSSGFDRIRVVVGPVASLLQRNPPGVSTVQVAISCRHGHVSPDTQEYITRKSEKLLTYFERVTAIEVTLGFEGERVSAEILVDAEHKHNFVASDEGTDAVATFDGALHKMEQQIKRYKEKLQDHRRDRPLNEIAGDPTAVEDNEED
jgi:putative sigma-54 modulation protein